MFHVHRVHVGQHLRERANTLRIAFKSAPVVGQNAEKALGKRTCFNGNSSRVNVPKAQYQCGWEWAPILTCGPYKTIRLETDDAAGVYDMFADAVVSKDLQKADLCVSFCVDAPMDVVVQATITSPDGKATQISTSLAAGAKEGSVATTII